MKRLFFSKSKELETEINEYLDTVSKAILVFKRDSNRYINKRFTEFEENFREIIEIEEKADEYQKDIKCKLYLYMLIPEARGDVLSIIESTDNLVDIAKKVLVQLSIEKPEIPCFLEEDFHELITHSVESVMELIKGIRSYFQNINMVDDYIAKVNFYEHEADKTEETLKRKAFSSNEITKFSKKVHIRYFSERISLLSDEAEYIGEQVSVAAIKRSI